MRYSVKKAIKSTHYSEYVVFHENVLRKNKTFILLECMKCMDHLHQHQHQHTFSIYSPSKMKQRTIIVKIPRLMSFKAVRLYVVTDFHENEAYRPMTNE